MYNSRQGSIIGIGFNLSKMFAKSEIEAAGANYYKVLNSFQFLTDGQIDIIYDLDIGGANYCVLFWTLPLASPLPPGPEYLTCLSTWTAHFLYFEELPGEEGLQQSSKSN